MKTLTALLLISVIAFTSYPVKANITAQKGLAMAYPDFQQDLSQLPISWWYDWTSNNYQDARYVPMSWCGEDPNLAADYSGFVLLFNEPEIETQCNITSQQGIDDYLALQEKYPDIKWVVGNTTFWGYWQYWLNSFWNLCNANPDCKMPKYWGVHVYLSGNAETWIDFTHTELDKLHDYIGGRFWVTEFAEINGSVDTDKALVNLFRSISYIDRFAYFTNRTEPNAPWSDWNISLFDWETEKLTAIGNWYINACAEIFLPLIIR